jgi:hypothetical protein
MPHHAAALTVTTALSLILACAGCGTPPWRENAAATPPPTVTPTQARTTTAPPAQPTTAPQNDLATGSAKRKLEAGGVRISINYWSTLPMSDWTSAAAKPLNLSASAKFIDGSKQDIFFSQVSVNVAVQGPKGPLAAPSALVDKATLIPGYLVTSPNSYGQVFTIPAVTARATSVTLDLTYEILAQTAPKARTYAKQTASDSLVIPIQP